VNVSYRGKTETIRHMSFFHFIFIVAFVFFSFPVWWGNWPPRWGKTQDTISLCCAMNKLHNSRSIGGELDVGEESFEQTIVTLQSLHHGSISYQHVRTWVGLTKKAKLTDATVNTSNSRKECNKTCRWMYSSWMWSFTNCRAAKLFLTD
jgi:hypothetical protein